MQIPLPQQTPLPSLQQIQQYQQYQLLQKQLQQTQTNQINQTNQQTSSQQEKQVPSLNLFQIQNQNETIKFGSRNSTQDMIPESPKPTLFEAGHTYDFTAQSESSKMEISETKPKVGNKRRQRNTPPKPFDSERSKQAMNRPRDENGAFTSKQKTNVLG